jgi:hypothetical protein
MYFIKIKPLKERLINRSMSDREALPYYLVFWACISVAGWATMPPQTTHWHMINNWVGLLVILGGTVFTFVKNGGEQGFDFIQKSIVLGWVITVRLVPLILCGIIGVVLFKQSRGFPDDQTSWVDVVFVVVFMIIYYQRLGKHIQDTSRKGEQCPPPLPPGPAGHSEGEG